MPLTLAAGSIAHDSVSEMPASSAPSSSNSLTFSLWSAQEAEAGLVVILDNDIVAVGRRRPEAVDAARGDELPVDDLVEQLLRVVPELACGRLLEDRRKLPLQLPGVEEELPVDVLPQRLERGLHEAHACELGRREIVESDALAVFLRVGDPQHRLTLALGL